MFDCPLRVGEVIDNARLREVFGCSPQGGMRRSNTTNTLVITTDPTGLYKDRWEGKTLHYTGMGQRGDQRLVGNQNKTLAESDDNGVSVHLFEVLKPQEYTYRGRVQLAGAPYQEPQDDVDDNSRQVWVFPVAVIEPGGEVVLQDAFEAARERSERRAARLSKEELRKRAAAAQGKAGKRKVVSEQRDRNPHVTQYAKLRANGVCQLCGQPAPFKNKSGEPYLETHHIVWLSKDGDDSLHNAAALCPNCHKKMHILNLKKDVSLLKAVVSEEAV